MPGLVVCKWQDQHFRGTGRAYFEGLEGEELVLRQARWEGDGDVVVGMVEGGGVCLGGHFGSSCFGREEEADGWFWCCLWWRSGQSGGWPDQKTVE